MKAVTPRRAYCIRTRISSHQPLLGLVLPDWTANTSLTCAVLVWGSGVSLHVGELVARAPTSVIGEFFI